MAEYIDRDIAIAKTTDMFAKIPDNMGLYFVAKCIDALDNIPAADVVEVVRCKDCVYSTQSEASDFYWDCNDDGASYHESHYCAFGERRNDNDE